MPVIDVKHDPEALTLTITSHFTADPQRVWQLFADPRQLERWFGPPEFPATFTEHALRPGGRSSYYMTGPDGSRYGGWWVIDEVAAPDQFSYHDGFADLDGNPMPGEPVSRNVVRLGTDGAGTTVVMTSTYDSSADLQKVLDMGVIEGASSAINQIDALLAA